MRLKTLLSTYREAGGADACILFHDAREGRADVLRLARHGKGLPARVIPLECFHAASVGMDLHARRDGLWREPGRRAGDGEDRRRLRRRAEASDGLRGDRSSTRSATPGSTSPSSRTSATCGSSRPRRRSRRPATFNLSPEKRTTLDFALDHLARHEGEDDSAAGRRALRRADGEQADLHPVQGLHRRVPGVGADRLGRRRRACASSSATACNAACASNTCPENAITLDSAAADRRESEGGGDAERGRAVQLRALRQALRHEADGRQHARQARAATPCSPAACAACRCAATVASST